jgi:hypothetical protein
MRQPLIYGNGRIFIVVAKQDVSGKPPDAPGRSG